MHGEGKYIFGGGEENRTRKRRKILGEENLDKIQKNNSFFWEHFPQPMQWTMEGWDEQFDLLKWWLKIATRIQIGINLIRGERLRRKARLWENPQMNLSKLYQGPAKILSRPTAQRAAWGLVMIMLCKILTNLLSGPLWLTSSPRQYFLYQFIM